MFLLRRGKGNQSYEAEMMRSSLYAGMVLNVVGVSLWFANLPVR